MLENVLDDYGVRGDIVSVRPGPVVTMYELEPAPGLKASRVIGLSEDIARSMSALSARVSTLPGRSVIGIELPNAQREKVVLREILAARDYGDTNVKLPLALGKDIGGEAIVTNLSKMPHLLIAGTTGSGKSVGINSMIISLLYKFTPSECKLILIDLPEKKIIEFIILSMSNNHKVSIPLKLTSIKNFAIENRTHQCPTARVLTHEVLWVWNGFINSFKVHPPIDNAGRTGKH